MARDGVTGAASSPLSSSSSSSSEEIERSQRSKLRETSRLLKCPGGEAREGDDDDCVVLGKDPFEEGEPEEAKPIADLFRKFSLLCRGEALDHTSPQQQALKHQGRESDDEDEVFIVGERGTVALRDYPHSRHLCGNLPFSKTPHESYCEKCYCYVCDRPAPCEQWKESSDGHCNATEQDDMWKKLREANRLIPQAKILLNSRQSL